MIRAGSDTMQVQKQSTQQAAILHADELMDFLMDHIDPDDATSVALYNRIMATQERLEK